MSVAKQIKNNEKFLQNEVDRIFDRVINSELTWQDRLLARGCIFCSGDKVNEIAFDIVAKCYEIKCGKLPTRSEETAKCDHIHWPVGTLEDIASFLIDGIQEGFPDLWAINEDMEIALPFGPIHAITILSNFDFAEFVYTRWADKSKSTALEEFHAYYNNNWGRPTYETRDYQKKIECDPVILEEIKKIEEQFFYGPAERHKDLEDDVKDAIIDHFGKTLLAKFERIDAQMLVYLWQNVEYAHLRRDWVMMYLKKIGKEWIESLKSKPYDFNEFERANEKLKFYQTWKTDPKMQEEWIKRKTELVAWKENLENQLGRKLSFDIWQNMRS